jgi:hypothetical protein
MMVRAGNLHGDGLGRVSPRLRASPDKQIFVTFFIRPLGRMTPLGSLTPLASDLP